YAMLAEARRLAQRGVDVVVGLVETHGRADTEAMLAALERIPLARISHRGSTFDELDVDKVLARRPAVVLVDELAHTCVPGSRHEKRWEDVEELLGAADEIEFVDITPQQLRARIADTQILASGATAQALTGFYTAERLAGLRE